MPAAVMSGWRRSAWREVHDRGAGAFMKPQPFTLALSNCQLRHDGGAASQDEVRRVSVRWVDGFLLTAVGNENAGYLANTLPDGAQNIYLALSTNDNNTLDKSNRIVRRTRSKIRCVCRKARSAAACSPITLAMFRQRRKAPPAGRLPAGQRGN